MNYPAPGLLCTTCAERNASSQRSEFSSQHKRLLYVNWEEVCAHLDPVRQEKNIWNHHGPGDTWARHQEKHRTENSSPFGQKLQIHFSISERRQPQLVINSASVLCSQKGNNAWKHPKYRYIFAHSRFTIHCNEFIEHTKLSQMMIFS